MIGNTQEVLMQRQHEWDIGHLYCNPGGFLHNVALGGVCVYIDGRGVFGWASISVLFVWEGGMIAGTMHHHGYFWVAIALFCPGS